MKERRKKYVRLLSNKGKVGATEISVIVCGLSHISIFHGIVIFCSHFKSGIGKLHKQSTRGTVGSTEIRAQLWPALCFVLGEIGFCWRKHVLGNRSHTNFKHYYTEFRKYFHTCFR